MTMKPHCDFCDFVAGSDAGLGHPLGELGEVWTFENAGAHICENCVGRLAQALLPRAQARAEMLATMRADDEASDAEDRGLDELKAELENLDDAARVEPTAYADNGLLEPGDEPLYRTENTAPPSVPPMFGNHTWPEPPVISRTEVAPSSGPTINGDGAQSPADGDDGALG